MNRIYEYLEFSDLHIVRGLFYKTSIGDFFFFFEREGIGDDYYGHTNWPIDH